VEYLKDPLYDVINSQIIKMTNEWESIHQGKLFYNPFLHLKAYNIAKMLNLEYSSDLSSLRFTIDKDPDDIEVNNLNREYFDSNNVVYTIRVDMRYYQFSVVLYESYIFIYRYDDRVKSCYDYEYKDDIIEGVNKFIKEQVK